jgi:hypothetical protein
MAKSPAWAATKASSKGPEAAGATHSPETAANTHANFIRMWGYCPSWMELSRRAIALPKTLDYGWFYTDWLSPIFRENPCQKNTA